MRKRDYITGFLVGSFLGACLLAVVIFALYEDAKRMQYGVDVPHWGPDHRPAIEAVKE